MIEFLWTFQKRIALLQPQLLLALAVVTLGAAVFILLGGLGFKKALFAVIGFYCGVFCSEFIFYANILLAIAIVASCVLLSMKLQDVFLTLSVSAFVAVYGFSVLIRPYLDTNAELIAIIRQLTIGVPYYNWPILLILIATPIAAASSYWRVTTASLCSAAGAALLFCGAIILFSRINFDAVRHIVDNRQFYLGLFIGVVVFSAFIQTFVLPRVSSRIASRQAATAKARKGKKHKKGNEAPTSKIAWRTS